MRTAHLLLSITAAVCLSCMLSCTKDRTGEEVRFQGRSFPGMPWTRIAYSGETYKENNTIYERINWEKNDPVMIMLKREGEDPETGKEYKIDEVAFSDNRISSATLVPNPEGYPWKGSGTHCFWAMYPSRSASRLSFAMDGNTPNYKVEWSITKTQNQTYKERVPMDGDNEALCYLPDMTPGGTQALLVGGVQASPSEHPNVRLDFYPAMNTFDFTVGTYGEITITDFKMETTTSELSTTDSRTVALTGNYTAIMTELPTTRTNDNTNTYHRPFTVTPGETTGRAIEAHFDPAVTLNATTWLNFKVFAMPTERKSITGVTIKFRLADNDNESSNDPVKSLALKRTEGGVDNWIEFPAYVKANITGLLIPGERWKITFDGPLVEEWVDAPLEQEIAVE